METAYLRLRNVVHIMNSYDFFALKSS